MVLNQINKDNNRQRHRERSQEKINTTAIQTNIKTILDKELKPKPIVTIKGPF